MNCVGIVNVKRLPIVRQPLLQPAQHLVLRLVKFVERPAEHILHVVDDAVVNRTECFSGLGNAWRGSMLNGKVFVEIIWEVIVET